VREADREGCEVSYSDFLRAKAQNGSDSGFAPMGVGSEVYGAVRQGRRGIGVELKASYFRQACRNVAAAANAGTPHDQPLFEVLEAESDDAP
jgi:hypothetical protein